MKMMIIVAKIVIVMKKTMKSIWKFHIKNILKNYFIQNWTIFEKKLL